ncbi:MAG: HDOD domain-containing protein [Archangium sp.]|nr:HDOD domain-containing protein [Archangium sp.]
MDLPFELDTEVVRLIKTRSIELPTYPGVALRLQALTRSGNYGLGELAKLVESDQALATALLRTANSAFYGGAAPITTLAPAIARVGANSLNNIAIAGTLGVQGSMEGPLLAMRKDSWRRSLISALLCEQLAPRRGIDAGEAFLAGLLHDFGETIAYACFEALLESHPESRPQNAASWLWEAQRYHVELGMALAAEWKLPDFVLATVMRHHDAELPGADFPALVGLVAMCDVVSTRLSEAASVDDVALDGVPGLGKADVAPLRAVMLTVPAFLESFDDGKTPKPAPSLVAQAPSTLGARAQSVDFPVAVVTRNGRTPYQATEMSPSAMRLKGDLPQPERQLINLDLGSGSKVCATVKLCLVSDAGCVIEVQPFAMGKAAQVEWTRLMGERAPRLRSA